MAIGEKELEKLLNSIDFKNLTPKQITGENGLLKLFNKKIIERAMGSEMDQHHHNCYLLVGRRLVVIDSFDSFST